MSRKIFYVLACLIIWTTSTVAEPNIVETAYRGVASESVTEMKDRIFGTPITVFDADYRRQAVAALPEDVRRKKFVEGNLWRHVEAVTRPVFQLHNRTNKLELLLYHDQVPVAMVWRGCILAMSDSLASSLSDEQLAGIIAHELAHAYFMDETVAFEKSGDQEGLRVVELKCDAVAMLTLKLLGSDPANFVSALRKIAILVVSKDYTSNSWRHPRLSEREKFSRRFITLLNKGERSAGYSSGLRRGSRAFAFV